MNYRHVLKMIDEVRMGNLRLPDNLLKTFESKSEDFRQSLLANVGEATAYEVTNIWKYLQTAESKETTPDGQKVVFVMADTDESPSLKMPSRQAWFEWTDTNSRTPIKSIGALAMESSPNPDDGSYQLTLFSFFLSRNGQVFGPHHVIEMDMSKQGKPRDATIRDVHDRKLGYEQLKHASEVTFSPVFMTLKFLHCKNVVQDVKEPPQTINERHRRKHPPLVTYRVLRIDRGKHYEGVSRTTGLEDVTRYHICRGHFKHYSEDKPLFGKFVGTYWWEAHARGNKELGEVIKDYEVAAS